MLSALINKLYVKGWGEAHELKMPNDIASGVRLMCSGSFVFRKHVVAPVSSLKVAFGRRAAGDSHALETVVIGNKIVLFFKAATIAIKAASKAFPS